MFKLHVEPRHLCLQAKLSFVPLLSHCRGTALKQGVRTSSPKRESGTTKPQDRHCTERSLAPEDTHFRPGGQEDSDRSSQTCPCPRQALLSTGQGVGLPEHSLHREPQAQRGTQGSSGPPNVHGAPAGPQRVTCKGHPLTPTEGTF